MSWASTAVEHESAPRTEFFPEFRTAEAAESIGSNHWMKRTWAFASASVWNLWCLASLIVLLAIVTAIPLLQLTVLGYLLLVAGRLTRGMTIRQSVPGLGAAGQMGIVFGSLGLASLPIRLFVHWESVAAIIEPDSARASILWSVSIAFSIAATVYLWWAWARGGRVRHFLWPEPIRFLRESWRPSTWSDISDRLWRFLVSLKLPMLFWLGVRGAVGTLIWLFPAMVIMNVTREGAAAAAGLLGAIAFLALGYVMLTLPMLQAHFAAENQFRAMFHWRRVRQDLRYAPWSYAAAMLVALVLLPIPLYLLKIEATPQEIAWLPCLVFVAFMLPAHIATGLAMRRCRRLHAIADASADDAPIPGNFRRRWNAFSRFAVRFLVAPAIVIVYLVVLLASQYTSWDGVDTWIRQHALLVPVPFVGI
ncbi:DUF4013 domain-containing protein [Aporhodopirellula aestuarii]|uniref:DUF4013 domain-containing protein n=1 Tax=Aporhodopirellula aestuarii TaxID=2950107 RepID=A0ABT0UDA1_9BACT|nr:DUF4013 domain-containing protein [Aporhodopirellula aestuarii]MCM2374735.1 DUF4013 domain-containing protein [Aporhodopirellula aestuarii]